MNNFKRFFIWIFIIELLGCSTAQNTGGSDPTVEKPNVVFIIVDDLNDYEGVFEGHPQAHTPNIDKLAESGVAFKNAYSNVPVCSPSRNSLFTGVYAHDSGDFKWTANFEQDVLKHNKTLMEYFRENGYHVAGSGKLLHKNKKEYWDEWGVEINNYGPVAFNGHKAAGHPSVPEPYRSIGAIDGSYAPLSEVPVFPDSVSKGERTGWVYSAWKKDFMEYVDENNRDLMPDEMHARWAVEKIAKLEKEEEGGPFFLGIGFVRPHTPLYAPKKYFDSYPIEEIQLPVIKDGDNKDTHYKDIYPATIKGLKLYRTLVESYDGDKEAAIKHFLQAYLACIAFMDDQVGKVVDAVNNSKFKNNTIIVLTSDHGWQMGEKEFLFKNSPWEESTRIPLIIKAPKAKTNAKVRHPVSLIDLFPTLKELCGLRGDHRRNIEGGSLGGYSLAPFLHQPNLKSWEGPNGALSMVGNGHREGKMNQTYSYRTKNWRYIRYYDGVEELYDHRNDPNEWNNLANVGKYSGQKEMLLKEMLEIINE